MPENKPFNHLKQARLGKMLYNINDLFVGRSIDLYGEFSQLEVMLFDQLVRPGDWVVDAGANIGSHTLFFAGKVGPSGRVFAFEPQRIVFQTLCANMALNSITNVECCQQGLSNRNDKLQGIPVDYESPDNFGRMSLGNYPGGEIMTVGPLDRFALPRCNFIKVDVEGMELQALQGAAATIARHKPLLYVENDRKEKFLPLMEYIDSIGYQMYWHRPALYNPDNFLGNRLNVFGAIQSHNLLCFHSSHHHKVDGLQAIAIERGG